MLSLPDVLPSVIFFKASKFLPFFLFFLGKKKRRGNPGNKLFDKKTARTDSQYRILSMKHPGRATNAPVRRNKTQRASQTTAGNN